MHLTPSRPTLQSPNEHSLLKKGDWLRADRFLSGENAQSEVPVPFFQQAAKAGETNFALQC